MKNIRTVRGMKDYLPNKITNFQNIEKILKNILISYGYNEIRTPIVEYVDLFKYTIGKNSTIFSKEMYTFKDKSINDLTLRPEGTTGCIRAAIQHGLLHNKEERFWYYGPMFRYERPQKGRYRQFHQLGAEVFGLYGPYIDAEIILLTYHFWQQLGINNLLTLEINTIGDLKSRKRYFNDIINFFKKKKIILNKKNMLKIYNNPMNIFNLKDKNINNLLKYIPNFDNYLDLDSKKHFLSLKKILDIMKIPYKHNSKLIRGLEYYNKTIFEWICPILGSQGTICAGGRYDGLVKKIGGKNIPGIGFAIGLERLCLLTNDKNVLLTQKNYIDIYIIVIGDIYTISNAFILANKIRINIPNIKIITNCDDKNLKKQFIKANKYKAHIALLLNNTLVKEQKIIIRNLLKREQIIIDEKNIISIIISILNKNLP